MTALSASQAAAPPAVSYDERAGTWTVVREFTVEPLGWTLIVPRGFTSDLASIPRWLWWLIAPFELSLAAALVHDYGYAHGGRMLVLTRDRMRRATYLTRARVDRAFYELMRDEGVWWWRRWLAYRAVRLFGASHWMESDLR